MCHTVHEMEATLFFTPLDIVKNGMQVVIEAGRVGIANGSYFVNHWIVHGLDSKSSSGVQIIGALSPLATQTDSMTGRMVALAKCRQFHVNR